MQEVKISIIVPCYNVEKLLPRCLDSLVNQTLKEIEIICVNDASPDNGIAILRDYESRYPNVRVIDLKENVCLGGARNRGMEVAQGEYIAFVDSDDYVERDMYEKLYARAAETGADVVTCDFDLIDEEYNLIGSRIVDRAHLRGAIDARRRNGLYLSLGPAWGKIQKKEILEKYRIIFPEHIFFEDLYFNLVESLYMEYFEYVPECLYHYFQRSTSIVRDKGNLRRISDRLKARDLALEYYREHGLVARYAHLLNYVSVRVTLENIGVYNDLFDRLDLVFLRDARKDLIKNINKAKGRNPFFRAYLTRKERVHLSLLKFSPWLYLNLWELKKKITKK